MVEIKSHNMAARPHFFDNPVTDELIAIILALTSELAVSADRLDTLERVLADAGVIPADAIERFSPDSNVTAERKQRHQDYLRRVFRVLRMQQEPGSEFAPFDQMQDYEALMEQARSS